MGVSYGSWVEVDGLDEARGECLGKVGCDHDDFHWMVVVVTGFRMRPEDLFCLYLELVADALHISLEDASKRIYLVSRCTCKGFCIRLDGCWMKNQLLESEFVWFIEQDCGYSIRSGESCQSLSESEGIKGAVKIIKDPGSDSKYHPFQQPAQTQIPAMVLQQTVPQMYPQVHASHLPYGQTSAYMQPLGRDPSYLLMSGDSTQLPGGGFKYGSPQYQTRYALKSGVTGRATHLYHPYKQPAQIQIPAMVLQQTVPHHMYTQVHASYQTSAYMPSLDSSQVALESSMEWERKLSQKSTLVGHVPTGTDAVSVISPKDHATAAVAKIDQINEKLPGDAVYKADHEHLDVFGVKCYSSRGTSSSLQRHENQQERSFKRSTSIPSEDVKYDQSSGSASPKSVAVSEQQSPDKLESKSTRDAESYADVGMFRNDVPSCVPERPQQHDRTGYYTPSLYIPLMADSVRMQSTPFPQEASNTDVAKSMPGAMIQQQIVPQMARLQLICNR